MSEAIALWLAVGGLALVCVLLLISVALARRAWARDLHAAHAELGSLRSRVDELEHDAPRADRDHRTTTEFVITDLGRPLAEPPQPAPLDRAMFTDVLVREVVVKAASLAHGVRRGLAPATRNRIRFEMKQEVRRARRQRRSDLKAAQRDLRARQRAALTDDRAGRSA